MQGITKKRNRKLRQTGLKQGRVIDQFPNFLFPICSLYLNNLVQKTVTVDLIFNKIANNWRIQAAGSIYFLNFLETWKISNLGAETKRKKKEQTPQKKRN